MSGPKIGLDQVVKYDLEGRVTLVPVARAKFVGLQCIKNTQGFLRVTTNVKVVNLDVTDDVVRIDDEGRTQGNTGIFRQNTKGC